MRIKSFALISFLVVVLLSIISITVAIGSEKDLRDELSIYKDKYHQARGVNIGPEGVDALKSGKYPKKVEENIRDFQKRDIQAYWINSPLHSGQQIVNVNIQTIRGTESNYEWLLYSPITRGSIYGESARSMPSIKPSGGKIQNLLLIKRKTGGPSAPVETKVTFTYYHPPR